ncbi:zinc-ribbon domain-containing protein [Ferroplasma acidiphilum]|jgi:DNA-binding MarR family transcriptional regulator|uniref:zinc-ribbon domain-containing protein n=1 Tax=Ferroplasma acidiphilum TaxID=74969 RepID=UPI0023F5417A|nr:zinc-ribbon domain-containing protein [Ferroplasma acidiphilum]
MSNLGKYAPSILIFLLDHDKVKKTDLLKVVPSTGTMESTVIRLEEQGVIRTEKKYIGRRIIYISLTEYGHAIAEQFKNINEITNSKSSGQYKICPVCGTKNDEDAKYCKNCGSKLDK